MVELKHCPSNPNPAAGDEDAPLYQRIKDHAVEFYEATPEQHMHCLRNTFNKYMTKLSKATEGMVPAKHSELEVAVTKAGSEENSSSK